MESTSSENDVKTFEMTAEDLGYYINLVNKEMSRFERKIQIWNKFFCG